MKLSNLHLVIILASLITVIVIAGTFLLVLTNNSNAPQDTDSSANSTSVTISTTTTKQPTAPETQPTTPTVTTTKVPSTTPVVIPSTTTTTPPVTTPPVTTPPVTTPPVTTPPVTIPPVTTPPVTTPPVTTPPVTTPPVTTPPVTTPPVTEPVKPGLNPVSGTVNGDKAGSLELGASYETVEINESSRTVKIKFTFYITSYSLRLGTRVDNTMTVNGELIRGIETPLISLPNGSPQTRTVLHQYTVEVKKPDDNTPVPLNVEFNWHFQASYSGIEAEWLSVKVDLNL